MLAIRRFFILFICGAGIGCSDYSPKPSGYFRIDLPANNYHSTNFENCIFDLSEPAVLSAATTANHFNIVYPKWKATVYCSLFSLRKSSLEQLTAESLFFIEQQAIKAQDIRTQQFDRPERNVYALVFHIEGNTASPTQFLLTDSIRSFLRGALYFDNIPNSDSIAPVLNYINDDIQHFIENFQWKR